MVDIIHTTGEKIMRLRNIPGADEIVSSSLYSIQNPTELKGHWHEFLHTDAPIHIEIGMGKGRFLMDLAAANPDIQYIGIERYTSVLLRAVQKMDELQLLRPVAAEEERKAPPDLAAVLRTLRSDSYTGWSPGVQDRQSGSVRILARRDR